MVKTNNPKSDWLAKDAHGAYVIWLDKQKTGKHGVVLENVLWRPKEVVDRLRTYLITGLLQERKQCSNCGGLVPDLAIEYEGFEYFFTCTRITRKGKTIAKTDYAQLEKYAAYLNARAKSSGEGVKHAGQESLS